MGAFLVRPFLTSAGRTSSFSWTDFFSITLLPPKNIQKCAIERFCSQCQADPTVLLLYARIVCTIASVFCWVSLWPRGDVLVLHHSLIFVRGSALRLARPQRIAAKDARTAQDTPHPLMIPTTVGCIVAVLRSVLNAPYRCLGNSINTKKEKTVNRQITPGTYIFAA